MTEKAMHHDGNGFVPLFDGTSLAGWYSVPRIYGTEYPGGPSILELFDRRGQSRPVVPEKHPARWFVENGVLVGEQDSPGSGYGGYLVSEQAFGDFELVLEMRPDWPADTGVMLRRRPDSWEGFQVLVDHRPSGGIGGFFGNGLASFSAVPFAVDVALDADGCPVGLVADDPATSVEPVTDEKRARLAYAADVEDFLKVWRWDDWNELRIRCVGALPVITTWINGVKIAELDTATLDSPNYNPADVLETLGHRGHIALEVHDNDERFGEARWGKGAQCRWRNIRIKELTSRGDSSCPAD
ncbi:3-keto-disaccharide hydrolase [Paenarthrobacter sp. NyZ202]|uniref:3-keto-disaccharide hydrolase n=1 Tax=Paenarthrobacter sp. NyZ202 TaxID=3402689 RepID=UPI003CEE9BCC